MIQVDKSRGKTTTKRVGKDVSMLTSCYLQIEFSPSLVHLSLTQLTASLVHNRLRPPVLAISAGQRYLKKYVGSGGP